MEYPDVVGRGSVDEYPRSLPCICILNRKGGRNLLVNKWFLTPSYSHLPERATIFPGPYSGCVTVMPCLKTSGETRGQDSEALLGGTTACDPKSGRGKLAEVQPAMAPEIRSSNM
jgi:hypothetical protein